MGKGNQISKAKTGGLYPLNDRIIVRPLPPETITPGGIVIPDQARQKSMRGRVIAAGPGRYNEFQDVDRAMTIRVGDTVLYSDLDGVDFTRDGEELTILSERDVLAVET